MKIFLLFIFYFLVSTSPLQGIKQEHEMKKRSIYFCILAGGSGERLWPLSGGYRPKQLLTLDDERTFLQQAIDRVFPLVQSQENLWIITSANYEKVIRDCVGLSVGTILVEPSARNTGPAILYSCLALQKIDPEALIVFLPADPFIPLRDSQKFAHYLSQAVTFASNNEVIALLGVQPTHPATGYGYIEFDQKNQDTMTGLHKVIRFHEKPCFSAAQDFIQNRSMLWNIGMFCGTASVFIDAFKHSAPDVFQAMSAYMSGSGSYEDIPSISVDYAVIEKSSKVWTLPVDFTWYDVGNIDVFLMLKQKYAQLNNNVIEVEAQNNLVDVPGLLVALVGVDNLRVVQTKDALLITQKDEAEKVKFVVSKLKERKESESL